MPESWSSITFQCASKLFLEEICILISRLSKEDWAHHCGLASSNLLRAWIEWRDGGRTNLLFTWTGTSIFACPETLALLVLGLSDSDWNLEPQIFRPFVLWITLLAFPILHFADSRLWDLFASIICESFPIIQLSIYLFPNLPQIRLWEDSKQHYTWQVIPVSTKFQLQQVNTAQNNFQYHVIYVFNMFSSYGVIESKCLQGRGICYLALGLKQQEQWLAQSRYLL